jgi:hypothetical protein
VVRKIALSLITAAGTAGCVFLVMVMVRQVLGHDSIETTLRFYIHASANAEQRSAR